MRVIAGRFGGRRLTAPRGSATRPTADRVREALFSMLGPLDGQTALDLFAGTGALGIEALSRGAARVVFVERDPNALAALRANLASLQLSTPLAQVRAFDALSVLERASIGGERYELIFLDPPYQGAEALAPKLSQALPVLLSPGGRVVVESDRRMPLQLPLPLWRERRYGDTSIRIHRNDEPSQEDSRLSRVL
ncbi:MAG TPA: 16S rRNA (guanine(966)-N(2))-methyltransferase RsmD [Solirubrobacteraceae bacterium]|jgi:16S rRNA (guanine(966)-N(2))-methyltransferase RsmD